MAFKIKYVCMTITFIHPFSFIIDMLVFLFPREFYLFFLFNGNCQVQRCYVGKHRPHT